MYEEDHGPDNFIELESGLPHHQPIETSSFPHVSLCSCAQLNLISLSSK